MNRARTIVSNLAALGLLLGAAVHSQGQCSVQPLLGLDRQADDQEGSKVALSGPFALVSAYSQDNTGGLDSGKVYCFHDFHGVWTQHSTISPLGGTAFDYFGSAVALADPYAIVSSAGYMGEGMVYIFQRSNAAWQQMTVPWPQGTAYGDTLGYSVGLNETGTTAVAGAPWHSVYDGVVTTSQSGIVYVYARSGSTWSIQTALYDSFLVRAANDHYGSAVGASGGVIVVGAPNGYGAGAARMGYGEIFRQNAGGQWVSELLVNPADGVAGDGFGSAAAVNGPTAVFGAPHAHNAALVDAGAVYVKRYVNGNWVDDGKLAPSDPTAGAHFGSSVSVSGDRIAVAAAGAHRTYIFRRIGAQQWVQDSRMMDPAGPDYYGDDIAIDGNTMLTGDGGDDRGGMTDGGVAYIYQIGVQEPSDTAQGATAIGDGTYYGCNTNATTDGYSLCSLQTQDGADVWYQFAATKTGTATLTTEGSALDTVLSVHSSLPSTLANTLACNDDFAPPARYSRVTIPVTKNQTYYVRLAGYGASTGTFTLTLSEACGADYDGNGAIEPADIAAFVNSWFTSLQQSTLAGDFDGNQHVEPADIAAFVNAWFGALNGGC